MYAVIMPTVQQKLTFAVLNISYVDRSKQSDVNFQTQNTFS